MGGSEGRKQKGIRKKSLEERRLNSVEFSV
jgi:hypothetical protein